MVLAVEEVEKMYWLIREAKCLRRKYREWLVGRLVGIQCWVSDLGRIL